MLGTVWAKKKKGTVESVCWSKVSQYEYTSTIRLQKDDILFSESDALTGELEKQFWKIKAPACFLSRPRPHANANNSVVDKLN